VSVSGRIALPTFTPTLAVPPGQVKIGFGKKLAVAPPQTRTRPVAAVETRLV